MPIHGPVLAMIHLVSSGLQDQDHIFNLRPRPGPRTSQSTTRVHRAIHQGHPLMADIRIPILLVISAASLSRVANRHLPSLLLLLSNIRALQVGLALLAQIELQPNQSSTSQLLEHHNLKRRWLRVLPCSMNKLVDHQRLILEVRLLDATTLGNNACSLRPCRLLDTQTPVKHPCALLFLHSHR